MTTVSPQVVPASVQTALVSDGDSLLASGEREFSGNNLHAAARFFAYAQENYTAAGNYSGARYARDRAAIAEMMVSDFPYNRIAVEKEVAKAFPNATSVERKGFLERNMTAILTADGEIWYFTQTVKNIQLHDPPILQKLHAALNHTPLYDELTPLIFTPWKNTTGPFSGPVVYEGRGELSIPRDKLPQNGTLKVWMPLPIESGPQTNVIIHSVEPARYVRSSTGTRADIGMVYLEIPLEEVKDPSVNVTTAFRFIQHEVRFVIDPGKVMPYNTSDPEYRKYTAPSKNIVITPAMEKKAAEIIGNETNPYLRAQKIFWCIQDTLPYSKAPHNWLTASGIPESVYVLETGIGDCGSQSMYFTALCRAAGIPARATGGMQMILGTPSSHIWAEFYLEGYGWIPVDVTAAEGADWSHNATPDERHRFREYYFGSLDPYRYVIEKDMDIPLVPDPKDPAITGPAFQEPAVVCDTCNVSPAIFVPRDSSWTVTFTRG